MTDSWTARSTYGNILKSLIKTQKESYDKEKDRLKKTKLAANIAYLIQILASLIRDEKNIESRIKRLEELQGIKK